MEEVNTIVLAGTGPVQEIALLPDTGVGNGSKIALGERQNGLGKV